MGKKKAKVVVSARAMTDEQFRLHLEKRHLQQGEYATLASFHGGNAFADCRPTHETYHRYLHRTGEYAHVHQQ